MKLYLGVPTLALTAIGSGYRIGEVEVTETSMKMGVTLEGWEWGLRFERRWFMMDFRFKSVFLKNVPSVNSAMIQCMNAK